MAKKHAEQAKERVNEQTVFETEHGRGVIQDNALKAVVTSKVFRSRVEKAKKGKGSFQRKAKHGGRESWPIAA
ncbi:ribosome alternative rescue factor ArfA [Photobacterium sp. CCB-ST2H9]|uniref:alternative ribosome-rescue factor A n=1 Tax=Photobacterium sp. CCB-ST2H9 TaxID=2912855 RepID=UPI0020054077|nr:ribosome alternative rescue factor ArfA [Photobacterium sp. CCB-ST2H9]UTM60216.1 ribosome alternative rescue factor ArfA [Photobacterium sp. CCB-ST2H9]